MVRSGPIFFESLCKLSKSPNKFLKSLRSNTILYTPSFDRGKYLQLKHLKTDYYNGNNDTTLKYIINVNAMTVLLILILEDSPVAN